MKKRILWIFILSFVFSSIIYSQNNQISFTVSYLSSEGSGANARFDYSYFIKNEFYIRANTAIGFVSDKFSYSYTDIELDAGYNKKIGEKVDFYLSMGLGYYIFLHQDFNGNLDYYYLDNPPRWQKQNSLGVNFKSGFDFYTSNSSGIRIETVIESIDQVSIGIGLFFDLK